MTEEWRPVVGYEGHYEVSNQGRVRSLDRMVPWYRTTRFIRGQEMASFQQRSGHLTLRLTKDGEGQTVTVHALVAASFLGPRPEGLQTRHLDGNPTNNTIGNLRYGTPAENMQDRLIHGRHPMANRTRCVNNHPFDDANTRIDSRGWRSCRACRVDIDRRYRESRKASA